MLMKCMINISRHLKGFEIGLSIEALSIVTENFFEMEIRIFN